MSQMLGGIPSEVIFLMQILAYLFIFVVGIIFFGGLVLYCYDRFQKKSTLRRNYPIIAHFRYLFEHIGEFLRQYFFALDRDELPFNRAQRSWCYRASKNVDSTVAFGSTKNIYFGGTVYFINSLVPILGKDSKNIQEVVIGPYTKNSYKTRSIINISGMSYGAISIPAIKALSNGAKQAGIWMNTGEGGLSSYHLESKCDIVFQIGTAKFGVRKRTGGFDKKKLEKVAAYPQVKMFEIKLSQGAKPGKGGILPKAKVTEDIAEIRGIEIGEDAISPNRHEDINNVDDLVNMINYVRDVTDKPVGFKTVIGSVDWLEELCKKIKLKGDKYAPDFITIDSSDGGTGAAPMSLIDSMGLPIKESLPMVVDLLVKFNLKDRIKVCASGKLINPPEVAWALCVGADFINSARGFMFALGCIQALQCNKNTCPTGITTHNKKLQYGLDSGDKAIRVKNYAQNMEKELSIIANSCGVVEPRRLSREHIRVVSEKGISMKIDQLYDRG